MLFDHAASVLVLAQPDKLRMSKMIAFGPLQEFDVSHELRADPNALFHAFGRQSFTPRERRASGRFTNGHFWITRG
jgi:hypothetical protein